MARGRHRARRQRHWGRALVLVFALGCAIAAATLAVVATDPRLLRVAVIAALLAALAPTMLPTLEQRASTAVDDELRRLRRELAGLRGELDAYLATGPITLSLQPASVQQPLVLAALHSPSPATNGNGSRHGLTIDLTRAGVTAD